MPEKVLIFGKNNCPFTSDAREAYSKKGIDFEYIDVLSGDEKLETMLKYSNGKRKVPVIIEKGKVTIGFNGKA